MPLSQVRHGKVVFRLWSAFIHPCIIVDVLKSPDLQERKALMFPTAGRQAAGVSAPVLPLSCASPKSPYFMVVESDKGFTTPPAPH